MSIENCRVSIHVARYVFMAGLANEPGWPDENCTQYKREIDFKGELKPKFNTFLYCSFK